METSVGVGHPENKPAANFGYRLQRAFRLLRDSGHRDGGGGGVAGTAGGASYSGAVGLSMAVLGCISAAMMGYVWTTMRGRQLWQDIEAEDRGRMVPDLKGLTVSQRWWPSYRWLSILGSCSPGHHS